MRTSLRIRTSNSLAGMEPDNADFLTRAWYATDVLIATVLSESLLGVVVLGNWAFPVK